jgi:hypothetical protein
MPRKPKSVLSHWHHLEENFSTSAIAFYEAVEAAVKAREAPDLEFSRVTWKEGGVLSASREYLRVKRGRIAFDCCAAPYGRGQFFSWWMAEVPGDPMVYLAAFLALGVGFVVGGAILFSLFDGCGGIVMAALLFFIGIPIAFFLAGRMVQEGAFPGLSEEQVLAIPFLGWLYEAIFQPSTYYRLDTALMFQETVRRAVNEVLSDTLSAQGLRALSEEELRPSMGSLVR